MYVLTPEREPMTDQSNDTTQVPLGEPVSLLGPKGSCITKAVDDSRELETWSSLNKMQAAAQV